MPRSTCAGTAVGRALAAGTFTLSCDVPIRYTARLPCACLLSGWQLRAMHATDLFRLVIKIGAEPALGFGQGPAFAFGVILDLFLAQPADHKILAVRV